MTRRNLTLAFLIGAAAALALGAGWNNASLPLRATGSLNFAGALVGVQGLTMSVSGAAIGDPCLVSPDPNAMITNVTYTCLVTSAGTVTVNLVTASLVNVGDPPSASFTVVVIK